MPIGQPETASIKWYVRKFYSARGGFDSKTYEMLLNEPFPMLLSIVEKIGIAVKHLLSPHRIETWSSWRSVRSDPPVDSFHGRLRWELAKILYCAENLRLQLHERDQIEIAMLNDDVDVASENLKNFDMRFGRSVWSLATKFRLSELEHGTDFNRTELIKFVDKNGRKRNSHWSNFLAHTFSAQCESTFSTRDFEESMKYLDALMQSTNSYFLNYSKYRLLAQNPTTDQARSDILHYESRHGILDVFDTCIAMLTSADFSELPGDIKDAIVAVNIAIRDPILGVIACLVEPESACPVDSPLIRSASEAIFLGNFSEALRLGLLGINEYPRYFWVYQLTALSAASLGDEKVISELASPSKKRLLNALFNWYSIHTDRKDSLEQLRRIGRFYAGTPLGWSIVSFIEGNDRRFDPLSSERVHLMASPTPVVQHVLHHKRDELATRFLNHKLLISTAPFHPVFLAVLKGAGDSETGVSNFTGLAVSRQLHLRAILAARTERHAVACRHLSALRQQFPDYYYSRPETQILEAFCLFETESFEEAARLSGTLCATNPNALPPVQLHRFADLIRDENREFDPSNVCWAILASALRSDDHESVSLDRVHDFVSDFIESQGCTVPTELLDKIGHNLDAVILSFFRDCCRPEIMESSIWIESQQELYQERLQLCERIKNGIDIALGIEGEIGSLMRKLAVIDITQRIERGKIFVDVEKICERTPDAQRDTIRRLLSIVAIRNNEVKQGLKLLGMPDREGGKLVVVSVDNGKELFRIAFEKIMEQYLFSPELGLDANLSQSIRHGPIIGGIRAIFDKFRLVTRKTSEGQYAENTHWKSLLSDSEVEGRAISSAFAQFTFEVDDFIRDVRLNRIQIRCSASPNGALDYDFTEQELGDIYNRLEPFHDVNDAIGVMLSALSDRTSFGLLDVQRQIMSQWNEHLQQMLFRLRAQLEDIVSDQAKLIALRTSITDCSTEIPRALGKIAAWFAQEDKREHKPFSIHDLVQSFEVMARKSGQKCLASFQAIGASDGDQTVDGLYFRPIWDLLFNLFDNALKHSGLDGVKIDIAIELNDQSTFIRVSNPLSDAIDLDLLRAKAEHLSTLSLERSSELSKLRIEGGSGVAKLHKIVRHEIGDNLGDYEIRFCVDEHRHFVASVRFNIGVKV